MAQQLTAQQTADVIRSLKARNPTWTDEQVQAHITSLKEKVNKKLAPKPKPVKEAKPLTDAQIEALLMGKSAKKRTPKKQLEVTFGAETYPDIGENEYVCYPIGGRAEKQFISIFQLKSPADGADYMLYVGSLYRLGANPQYKWMAEKRDKAKFKATADGDAKYLKSIRATTLQQLGTITLNQFKSWWAGVKEEDRPLNILPGARQNTEFKPPSSLGAGSMLEDYCCYIGDSFSKTTAPDCSKEKSIKKCRGNSTTTTNTSTAIVTTTTTTTTTTLAQETLDESGDEVNICPDCQNEILGDECGCELNF